MLLICLHATYKVHIKKMFHVQLHAILWNVYKIITHVDIKGTEISHYNFMITVFCLDIFVKALKHYFSPLFLSLSLSLSLTHIMMLFNKRDNSVVLNADLRVMPLNFYQ